MITINSDGNPSIKSILLILLINIIIFSIIIACVSTLLHISFWGCIGLIFLAGFGISTVESIWQTFQQLSKKLTKNQ